MFMMPEVLTLAILNLIFLLFSTIAFYLSVTIVLQWDKFSASPLQYKLEKQSYLAATIIKYMFFIKIPLFMFFIFTLDKISFVLPGAMCAAGVVNATIYATPLLFLKILNIYLFAYWILLDAEDMKQEAQPYLKLKFIMFIFLYFLLLGEIFLETINFLSIDVTSVVDCCGTIFSTNSHTYISYILGASPKMQLTLFYGVFLMMLVSAIRKNRYLLSFLNIFFLAIALMTLISFFGTYIYELPTHHCPFCLLQEDYHYVGYLLYAVLFLGTFNGISVGFVEFSKEQIQYKSQVSIFFNTLYVIVISLYPLSYYIRNGVWL